MTISFLDQFRPRLVAAQPAPGPAAVPVPVFDGLAQVRAYWEGLRCRDVLPGRAALDPRGLGNVLDRVFLAERIGRGLVQVRLAGSALTAFAGNDLRGLPLSCIFDPECRPVLAQVLETVVQTPSVAELDLGPDRGHRGVVAARLVLLPLAEDCGTRQILGAFGFAPQGLRPCKLQIMARREERLLLPPAPDARPPEQTRFGHLRLVQTEA